MLIAVPALQAPGGCTTMAVLLGVLAVASIVWCGRVAVHRPPILALLAAAPVLVLVLVPFLAVGHAGILGVGFNNDMAPHMAIAEGYLSGVIGNVAPPDYPIGPHAMVAVIAEGLGIRVDQAFAGWSMALPVLSAWTALAFMRRASWPGHVATVTVVGIPFLIAAYYGQGAFKEVLQACLVLATAVVFCGYGPKLGRGRWVPLALLLGGILSVYSVAGLPWPIAFGGLWLIVTAALQIRRGGIGSLRAPAIRELPAIGIGLAVLIVSILPQLPRIHRFITLDQAASIAKDDIGNLAGPLPGWEAFGVWNTPDFRLPASPAFSGGMWTAFVLALVLFGFVWLVRRGRWMLPLAAGGSMLIWAVSTQTQSPYVAAKALVIASPLLLAVAVVPLAEQLPDRLPRSISSAFRSVLRQPFSWGVAAILVAVLFLRVGISDVQALRASPVGPTDHADELRTLRPLLHDQPTLFLGNDDFIRWELAGVPVHAPVVGLQELPIRPQKAWSYGKANDFDTIDAATLNSFDWIITTRDAAGSAPPAGVRFVRATPNYVLWHRVRRVDARSILAEGEMAGAVLNCRTPTGRAVLRGGGVAAVRPQPVTASGLFLEPGATGSVQLRLGPGRWQLESSYVSRLPIDVTAPGLQATLPASLDRPGSRWPIGRLTVRGNQLTAVTFTVADPLLAPALLFAELGTTVATRDAPVRIVPVQRACGRYIDWYKSEG
ncbi:MAG TPA: hypothetical protein VH275_02590 [Solirubrobacterales bacterium]|nr:hypothetical protein [Solirubrobacterales bacterium]